jgi:hypothetical protein
MGMGSVDSIRDGSAHERERERKEAAEWQVMGMRPPLETTSPFSLTTRPPPTHLPPTSHSPPTHLPPTSHSPPGPPPAHLPPTLQGRVQSPVPPIRPISQGAPGGASASSASSPSSQDYYSVMFKSGDDLRQVQCTLSCTLYTHPLRQDQLIMQLIGLMDKALKRLNLDLRLTPFKV